MSPSAKLTVAAGIIGAFVLGRYWPGEQPAVTMPRAEHAPSTRHDIPAVPPASPAPRPPGQTDTLYDRFVARLGRDEWAAAVDLYDSVYTRFDESVSSRFRDRLLDTASVSLGNTPRRSVGLLSAYTDIYFQDVTALQLLADGLVRLGEPEPALRALHGAYLAAHLPDDQARIQSRIDKLVEQRAQELMAGKDYAGLVKLYQLLVDQRPGYPPYYMQLAEAHLQHGDEAEARRALRYIQYDNELGNQARRQIARLDDAAPRNVVNHELVVPMTRVANNFVVPVLINNAPLQLLLDTGASVTVLRPESAYRIGAEPDATGAINLETANGRIRAPLAFVRSLDIGGDTLSELKVAIVELNSLQSVDGLLGMDVLSRYRVTIDRQHSILRLSR